MASGNIIVAPGRKAVGRRLASVAIGVVLLAPLNGQDYVKGWGTYVFDTSAYDRSDFVQVSGGNRTSVALRADGTVMTWGSNGRNRVTPSLPLPATKVGSGFDGSLALLTDGSIVAWGFPNSPTVPSLPVGVVYVDISMGEYTCLGLRSDGGVEVFGDTANGRGSVPALPTGVVYSAIEASGLHHVALRSDGQVVAWGDNSLGGVSVPALPAGVVYTEISSGRTHSLALRSDGQVVAWGGSNYPAMLNVPTLPVGHTYTNVRTGRFTSGALRSDGNYVFWGWLATSFGSVPTLPAGVSWRDVQLEGEHVVGLRTDGRVECWGDNRHLGCNFPMSSIGNPPIDVDATDEIVAVLREDGTFVEELSPQMPDRPWAPGLPPVPAGVRYTKFRTWSNHAVAVRSDGLIGMSTILTGQSTNQTVASSSGSPFIDAVPGYVAWVGLRADGSLVQIDWNGVPTPTQPPPAVAGNPYVEVEFAFFGLARRADGSLVDWAGSPTSYSSGLIPSLPSGLRYVEIDCGWNHSIARVSDGSLRMWVNTTAIYGPAIPPPPLPTGTTYVEIAAGHRQCAARRSDGSIVSWSATSVSPDSALNGTNIDESISVSGLSYRAVRSGEHQTSARIGPESSYVTFANGCAGSRPPSRLIPLDTPAIGEPFEVRLFDLPDDAALLIYGLSNTTSAFGPLPFSTAPIGIPGCSARVSPDYVEIVTGSGEQAASTWNLPNQAALIGARFYNQALVIDAAAGNAANMVLSDAAEAIIGR